MTRRITATAAALALASAAPAAAHYGMIIPSDPMIGQEDGRSVDLTVSFSHPFEEDGMVLERPEAFTVTHAGETTDLTGELSEATVMDAPGYTLTHELERPGTHVFAMTPVPYWEPAEDAFIQHFTKTYVSAYDDDEGWDAELGLRTEIVPLSKPFGLWAGNVFQGIVHLEGEPVPYAEIEVEFYNEGQEAEVPSELMITQTIKADANGVFTYSVPEEADGWWGFAALNTAPETMEFEGEAKAVELGAVIWVRFEEWDD
jgi:cobalt/nickel transport protein